MTAKDGTLIVPPRKLSPAFQDRKDVKEVCVLCSPACLPELISLGLCSWGNSAPHLQNLHFMVLYLEVYTVWKLFTFCLVLHGFLMRFYVSQAGPKLANSPG